MHLTPKEIDKLMLLSLGMIAERRMKKGLKLNYAILCTYVLSVKASGRCTACAIVCRLYCAV